jgi:hypothetical protein
MHVICTRHQGCCTLSIHDLLGCIQHILEIGSLLNKGVIPQCAGELVPRALCLLCRQTSLLDYLHYHRQPVSIPACHPPIFHSSFLLCGGEMWSRYMSPKQLFSMIWKCLFCCSFCVPYCCSKVCIVSNLEAHLFIAASCTLAASLCSILINVASIGRGEIP